MINVVLAQAQSLHARNSQASDDEGGFTMNKKRLQKNWPYSLLSINYQTILGKISSRIRKEETNPSGN